MNVFDMPYRQTVKRKNDMIERCRLIKGYAFTKGIDKTGVMIELLRKMYVIYVLQSTFVLLHCMNNASGSRRGVLREKRYHMQFIGATFINFI
ncbi:hypothetical protein SDC9_164479 [bioreactor metagenome]|uniref:Uncharacterized protein n=1 Tax=bioreactor metagenome TaxID=1076179 RepID=A0A645FUE5_9ZZZZ